MIGWGSKSPDSEEENAEPKGFDAFDVSLGDMMRGERATLGKSLLDVQRELKIKAGYIAAIENADPSAFDTPGFIAGYVRSYARYLNMDPEQAFKTFCAESGFVTAHGMSEAASGAKADLAQRPIASLGTDMFEAPRTPFTPEGEPMFGAIEPRAVGSIAVLLCLIGGLGYGAWSVLQEVQRVQFAPVNQTPEVASNVDPLAGGGLASAGGLPGRVERPSADAFERLYRPQALEVPVMVARDAPIASLDPREIGTLALAPVEAPQPPEMPSLDAAVASTMETPSGIRVTEEPAPAVQLVAVRPAWVRVRSAEGDVLYEATMQPGDTYVVPQAENPATLRIGESGAVYFALNGVHYGPVGETGKVTSNLALSAEGLQQTYATADLTSDNDLACQVQVAGNLPAGWQALDC